jgi:two-component system phosphate regulon sensor histidine kinase PhoR
MGPWGQELRRLAVVLAMAAAIGIVTGYPGWALVLALGGLLAWQLRNLYRLQRCLGEGGRLPAHQAHGLWGELCRQIQHLQKQNKKRKKRLGNMLKHFQQSTMALPYGTITVGEGGEIEWFNRSAGVLLGLNIRTDKGQRISELVNYPNVVTRLEHSEDSGDSEDDEPLMIPSPVDAGLTLGLRIVPFGKKQHLITVQDITRESRLEVLRKEFVANVSHELRTPLTVLTGYLETLGEEPGILARSEILRTVREMGHQAARMLGIVEDLLLLARLESSDVSKTQHAPVPVPSLLLDIKTEAEVLSNGLGHIIRCELEEALWLQGDSRELYSAFSNLVTNAVRYSPKGGKIEMRWYADTQGAHFLVRDQGMGIDRQHLERLTERFYRVDKDRSRASGGTGLGLAIVKHVLQRHEAMLRIESEPGKGSAFCCDFPACRIVRQPERPRLLA